MYNYHGFNASADVLVETHPTTELVEAAADAVAELVASGAAPEHYVPGLGVVYFLDANDGARDWELAYTPAGDLVYENATSGEMGGRRTEHGSRPVPIKPGAADNGYCPLAASEHLSYRVQQWLPRIDSAYAAELSRSDEQRRYCEWWHRVTRLVG